MNVQTQWRMQKIFIYLGSNQQMYIVCLCFSVVCGQNRTGLLSLASVLLLLWIWCKYGKSLTSVLHSLFLLKTNITASRCRIYPILDILQNVFSVPTPSLTSCPQFSHILSMTLICVVMYIQPVLLRTWLANASKMVFPFHVDRMILHCNQKLMITCCRG